MMSTVSSFRRGTKVSRKLTLNNLTTWRSSFAVFRLLRCLFSFIIKNDITGSAACFMLELREKGTAPNTFICMGWQKLGAECAKSRKESSREKLLLFEINGVKDFVRERSCAASSASRQLLWKIFAMATWGQFVNDVKLCFDHFLIKFSCDVFLNLKFSRGIENLLLFCYARSKMCQNLKPPPQKAVFA